MDNTKKLDLLDTLKRSFDGDAWHGPAVKDVLKGVSEQDAARQPPGRAHSIWAITLHIAAWTNEVARRLQGHEARTPAEGDWPITGGSWDEAIQRVFNARDNVLNIVDALSPEDLDTRNNDPRNAELGTGFSYTGLIEGLAQHNAYHAGQIMLLRRIFKG